MSEFLLHIAMSIAGAAGLVGFLTFRITKKAVAFLGTTVFIAASAYFLANTVKGFESWRTGILNWVSILGSGTASLSAILYLISQFRPQWRAAIFKSFLMLFKIIWLGVGVIASLTLFASFANWGFVTAAWFIDDAFIFSQILFAVIVLNGFYIGKRIGFGLVQLIKQTPSLAPDKSLAMRIAASGSVSIVSWYGFLASGKGVLGDFSLQELLGLYLAMILSVFVINVVLEQIRQFLYERPH